MMTNNNPWMGLVPYQEQDSSLFFGRDKDLDELCVTLKNNLYTVLYGISGSGKSSLINAGILPKMKKMGYLPVPIRLSHISEAETYSSQIINSIETCIKKIDGEIEDPCIENIRNLNIIPENEKLWLYFHTHYFWDNQNYRIKPIIIIDQFEEIFTWNQNDTSRVIDFFKSIEYLQSELPPPNIAGFCEKDDVILLSNNSVNYRFLYSLREDFLPRLEDYCSKISSLRKNRYGMHQLNGNQALDVILKPNPGIVTRSVAIKVLQKISGQSIYDDFDYLEHKRFDTSILSLFCNQLYTRAVEKKLSIITEDLVEDSGRDILRSFYENTLNNINNNSIKFIEEHLLTESGYRNNVAIEDAILQGIREKDLYYLASNRIITIDASSGTERMEFTHDVLCRIAKARIDEKKSKYNDKIFYYNFVFASILFVIFTMYKALYGHYSISFLLNFLFDLSVLVLNFFLSKNTIIKSKWGSLDYFIILIINIITFNPFLYPRPNRGPFYLCFLLTLYLTIIPVINIIRCLKYRVNDKYIIHLSNIFINNYYKDYKNRIKTVVFYATLCIVSIIIGLKTISWLSVVGLFFIPTLLVTRINGIKVKSLVSCVVSVSMLFISLSDYFEITSGLSNFLIILFTVIFYFTVQLKKRTKLWKIIFSCILIFVLPTIINGLNIYQKKQGFSRKWIISNTLPPSYMPYEDYIKLSYVYDSFNNIGIIDRDWNILVDPQFKSLSIRYYTIESYCETFSYSSIWLKSPGFALFLLQSNIQRLMRQLALELKSPGPYNKDYLHDFNYRNIRIEIAVNADNKRLILSNTDISQKFPLHNYLLLHNSGSIEHINRLLENNKIEDAKLVANFDILYRSELSHTYEDIGWVPETTANFGIESVLSYPISQSFIEDKFKKQIESSNSSLSNDFLDYIISLDRIKFFLLYPETKNYIFNYLLKSKYSKVDLENNNIDEFINYNFDLFYLGKFENSISGFDFLVSRKSSYLTKDQYYKSILGLALNNFLINNFQICNELLDKNVGTKLFVDNYQYHYLIAEFLRILCIFDYFNLIDDYQKEELVKIKNKYERFNFNTKEVLYSKIHDLELCTINDNLYNNKYLIKDNEIISPNFYRLVSSKDEHTGVLFMLKRIDNKLVERRSFIDFVESKILTEPIFDKAWVFSDGLAAVQREDSVGFIDKTGNFVIPMSFYNSKGKYNIIDYIFHNKRAIVVDKESHKYGVIDTEGRWVILPVYDEISGPYEKYYIVKTNGQSGIIDYDANIIINLSDNEYDLFLSDDLNYFVNNICYESYELAFDLINNRSLFNIEQIVGDWYVKENKKLTRTITSKGIIEFKDIGTNIATDYPAYLTTKSDKECYYYNLGTKCSFIKISSDTLIFEKGSHIETWVRDM